jgi:5'-nucleotidase
MVYVPSSVLTVTVEHEGYIRTAIERTSDRLQPGTDIALLAEGLATVTPAVPSGP